MLTIPCKQFLQYCILGCGLRSVQGELLVIFHFLSLSLFQAILPRPRGCVYLLFLTRPSFLFEQLGTFALIKLPTLWWGTLFIKMKMYILEVLTELCLYIFSIKGLSET